MKSFMSAEKETCKTAKGLFFNTKSNVQVKPQPNTDITTVLQAQEIEL